MVATSSTMKFKSLAHCYVYCTVLAFSVRLVKVVHSLSDHYASAAQNLRHLFQDPASRGTTSTSSSPSSTTTTSTSIILPGVHDALSAKMFALSGARALFLSGFGVSASRLGQPDMGILSQTEMEDTLRNVVQAATVDVDIDMDVDVDVDVDVNDNIDGNGDNHESTRTGIVPKKRTRTRTRTRIRIPVIVDGDTGYGGAANIRRMVHSFAAAGAAAITIEDQVFPKQCTYAAGEGVRVVSRAESLVRVNAALAARDEVQARVRSGSGSTDDVLIVARTDCRAALGLEEAMERCKLYEEAGADIVYAENLQSREEYEALRRCLKDSTPMILAQVQVDGSGSASGASGNGSGVGQTLFTAQEVGEMGYDFALFGITGLQAAVAALQSTASIMLHGTESSSSNDSASGDSGSGLVLTMMENDDDEDENDENDENDGTSKLKSNHISQSLTSFRDLKDIVGFEECEKFQSKYEL